MDGDVLDPPFASEANIEGPPVVANGRVYLRITAGGEEDVLRAPIYSLVSLDRATGEDVQRVSTDVGFDLLPIAVGDAVSIRRQSITTWSPFYLLVKLMGRAAGRSLNTRWISASLRRQ